MEEAKSNSGAPAGKAAVPPTVSHMLGEMTWLLSQSPLHNVLQLKDLEWLVMPALIHEQFYLFRDGDKPVGLALWAKCDEAAEKKLEGGMIEPKNRLTLEQWVSGDRVWIVDLVAPFATAQNHQREIMIADLIAGPLLGQEFRFHLTDPATGKRSVQTISADASEALKRTIEAGAAET